MRTLGLMATKQYRIPKDLFEALVRTVLSEPGGVDPFLALVALEEIIRAGYDCSDVLRKMLSRDDSSALRSRGLTLLWIKSSCAKEKIEFL